MTETKLTVGCHEFTVYQQIHPPPCYLYHFQRFNYFPKVTDIAIDYQNIKFELSILDSRIRLFETLLHISSKITLKMQIRTQDEKDIVNKRKAEII